MPSSLLWSYCAGRVSSGSSRRGVTEVRFQTDAFGRLDLDGLPAGADLALTVRGPLGRPLAERRLRTPEPGEQLAVELEADAPTFELALRVEDEAGRGLHAAEIELNDERGNLNARTDADGRAVVRLPADVGELELEASHPGRVARRLEGVRVDRGGAPLVIALTTGRTVRARVVDEDGRALLPEAVIAGPEDGPRVWAETLDGEEFVLAALPHGPVPVEVRVGHRQYAFTHDTSIPDATFVVPPHGWLELALAESVVAEDGTLYLSLRHEAEGELQAFPFSTGTRPLRCGRYAARLVRRWWEDGTRHEALVGTPVAFDVPAGETTRVVVGE